MSKAVHDIFKKFLIKHGSRYTPQKKLILSEVLKMKRHFEIESFLSQLYKKHERFSRATVYRTIKQLLDAKLIQKVVTQDGKVFYEPCKEQKQHDHLICKACGKIFEIKATQIEDFLNSYCASLAFTIEYRSIHVYGSCQQCSKK